MVVSVEQWSALRVNQETVRVAPGATVPLCQAIPLIALTAHLRATVPGRSVRVRLRVPGHPVRTRRVTLRRRTRVTFTPRGLHLRQEAFPEGTYRLTVRRGGRVRARASLHLRGGGVC